jgi:hypothetical protein
MLPLSAISRRFAPVLGLLALAAGTLAPAAHAQKCTLGWDTPRWVDRPPTACAHAALNGRLATPTAAGPLGRLWVARDTGDGWHLASQVGDGLEDGPALGLDGPPAAMVAGPDGALYVAGGRTVARWDGTGAPQNFTLPAPLATFSARDGLPVGQLASAGGAVWVPLSGGLVRLDPSGAQSYLATARRPRGGVAAGADNGLWFSAGSELGRLDLGSGGVSYVPASPDADGALAGAPRGASGIWYASRSAGSVNVRAFSGQISSYDVLGEPLGMTPGPGRYSVWVAGGNGSRDWLARVATAGRPSGHPAGVPCAWEAPISCGINLHSGSAGDIAYFNARATALGGVTVGGDNSVYYTENGYVGRVMAFRGLVPCVHLQPMIGRYRASSCKDGQWSSFVTRRPVAYPRVSCLQLTFGYCAGSISLYYRRTFLGRGAFVVQGYDNPDARVAITPAGYRLIRSHRRLRARAVIDSFDFGQVRQSSTWSIVLYPGNHQVGG